MRCVSATTCTRKRSERSARRSARRRRARAGCAKLRRGSSGSRRGRARARAAPTMPVRRPARRARAARRRRRLGRPPTPWSSSFGRGPTSPPARPSTCSAAPSSCARASSIPAADVLVVRDAHRHAWMRQAADDSGAVVVETGLPVWRPGGARGYLATLRRRPRVARGGRGGARPVTSHLERELREQPEALARLIEKQRSYAERDREALPARRRAVRLDRLARQLVQRGALRAVLARPRAPGAGGVCDAVAVHALRAAAAPRRRARGRHLAVGRVAGRRRGARARRSARAGRRSRSRTRRRRRSGSRPTRSLKLEAGKEQAVAATKTYVNSLGAIALIFAVTTGDAQAIAELAGRPRPDRRPSSSVPGTTSRASTGSAPSTAAPSSPAGSTTARRTRSR